MLTTLFQFSLLLISLYGGSHLFSRYLKINRFFSWIAFNSFVVLVLYISAFFDQLSSTTYVLYVISFIAGISHLLGLLLRRELPISNHIWATIWMLFYCVIIGSVLWQTQLEHYDNFSHWSLIVKFLFTEGQLPSVSDTIISYTSYPMGSSLFIYYVVKIVGFHDHIMLLGQFIFIASALYALFSVIRDHSRTMVVTLMMAGIASMNYFNISIRMNNLLVDFVLPALALAGIAAVFAQRKSPKKMSLLVFLITAVLNLVKSSGLFFSLIVWIYYLFEMIKARKFVKSKIKQFSIALVTLIASLAPILYWNAYVKVNFPVTKHEVSLTSYQSIFNAKDTMIVQEITQKLLHYLTDLRNVSTQGFLLFNLLMLIAIVISKYKLTGRNRSVRYFIVGNLFYLLYSIGLLMMFLFSMPTDEAVTLAGIERYTSSMVIFLIGLAVFVLVQVVDYSFYEQNIAFRSYRSFQSLRTKNIYQWTNLILGFFTVLMMISETNGMRYHNAMFHETTPAQFLAVGGHEFELNEDRYLIVSTNQSEVESYYTGFLGSYYLYSPDVVARENFMMDLDEFEAYIRGFDQIIILEEHYTFNAMMNQLIGQHVEPGRYEIGHFIED